MKHYNVIIIGAGAAGLFCAAEAGKRGRSVIVLDHAKRLCEKIRISGGGRCNFTNIYAAPENFLSQNPHFCKSALSRYTQYDFIALMDKHAIPYHEKKLGQLFCDNKAQDLIDMLLKECEDAGVIIQPETMIESVTKSNDDFILKTSRGEMACQSFVVACGGLSIPKIGATGFGYDIAQQFEHEIVETRPALVPLTFTDDILTLCKDLTGLSAEAKVYAADKTMFAEGLLFTHRGLSGPSILQISSYWKDGQDIIVNLLPDYDVFEILKERREVTPKQDIVTVVSEFLPKRLASAICDRLNIHGRLADISNVAFETLGNHINAWAIKPSGSEGYRTAEVTLGGVSTDKISSKTMESKLVDGLYFIGEVLDVTGHLGGFNFQWAWSSGWAAGQCV
jgi:predicted Rossmann fold flavoprotein